MACKGRSGRPGLAGWTGAVLAAAMILGVTAADGVADGKGDGGRQRPAAPLMFVGPSAAPGGDELGRDAVRSHTARIGQSAVDVLCGRGRGDEVIFPLFDDTVVHVVEQSRARED